MFDEEFVLVRFRGAATTHRRLRDAESLVGNDGQQPWDEPGRKLELRRACACRPSLDRKRGRKGSGAGACWASLDGAMGYAGGFAFAGRSDGDTGPSTHHDFAPRGSRNACTLRDACVSSGSAYGRPRARARARSFETFATAYSGLIS